MDQVLLPYMLRAPGRGVFTVHTADDIIKNVQTALYQSSDPDEIHQRWQSDIAYAFDGLKPLLLGICSDCGGGIQRGANWGPLWIRQFMTLTDQRADYIDLGDLPVIPHLLYDELLNEKSIQQCREALYTQNIALASDQALPVSPLSIAQKICELLYRNDHCPYLFVLGGDHSVSYPLTYTWLQARKAAGKRVAIIHFDAHTDLLDRRQGVDFCFATWAYHILPFLQEPSDLIQLGIRSSGKTKVHWESTLGVKQYWADEVIERIDQDLCDEIVNSLKDKGIEEIYISVDIDALDEFYASATGTPEPNGLAPHHVTKVIQAVCKVCTLTGADLVEVAPWVHRSTDFIPTDRHPFDYSKKTLQVAADLSQQLLMHLHHAQHHSQHHIGS
jgi:agmatinase